jgi:hypothetical protein
MAILGGSGHALRKRPHPLFSGWPKLYKMKSLATIVGMPVRWISRSALICGPSVLHNGRPVQPFAPLR